MDAVIQKFGLKITSNDLDRLQPGNWLNDSVKTYLENAILKIIMMKYTDCEHVVLSAS